jgi:hypothetical protein
MVARTVFWYQVTPWAKNGYLSRMDPPCKMSLEITPKTLLGLGTVDPWFPGILCPWAPSRRSKWARWCPSSQILKPNNLREMMPRPPMVHSCRLIWYLQLAVVAPFLTRSSRSYGRIQSWQRLRNRSLPACQALQPIKARRKLKVSLSLSSSWWTRTPPPSQAWFPQALAPHQSAP